MYALRPKEMQCKSMPKQSEILSFNATEMVHVVIHGHPTPQGRPRGRRRSGKMIFFNPNHEAHELLKESILDAIRQVVCLLQDEDEASYFPLFVGHVGVECIFYFKRPIKHYIGKLRDESKLRMTAVKEFPVGGGDVDNLVKFILDALQGILYMNDKNVIKIVGEKKYTNDEDERTEIKCYKIQS